MIVRSATASTSSSTTTSPTTSSTIVIVVGLHTYYKDILYILTLAHWRWWLKMMTDDIFVPLGIEVVVDRRSVGTFSLLDIDVTNIQY